MRFCQLASALILSVGLIGCKKAIAPVAPAPASAPAPLSATLPPAGQELSKNRDFSVIRLDPNALPDLRYADIEGIGKEQHRRVEGRSLEAVICRVWATTVARTDWRASPPGGLYTMVLPGAEDTRYTTQEAFAQAFHTVFHLRIYQKDEDRSVLVLKTPEGGVPSALAPADPGEDQFRGIKYSGATFKGYTMDEFADWMEAQWEGKPVFNETNLPGKYNFVLKGNVILQPESIPAFVRDLGFEQVTETRRMSVVVVENE